MAVLVSVAEHFVKILCLHHTKVRLASLAVLNSFSMLNSFMGFLGKTSFCEHSGSWLDNNVSKRHKRSQQRSGFVFSRSPGVKRLEN